MLLKFLRYFLNCYLSSWHISAESLFSVHAQQFVCLMFFCFMKRKYILRKRYRYLSDIINVFIVTYLQEGESFHPKDDNGKVIFSDVDYVDTWKVLFIVFILWKKKLEVRERIKMQNLQNICCGLNLFFPFKAFTFENWP